MKKIRKLIIFMIIFAVALQLTATGNLSAKAKYKKDYFVAEGLYCRKISGNEVEVWGTTKKEGTELVIPATINYKGHTYTVTQLATRETYWDWFYTELSGDNARLELQEEKDFALGFGWDINEFSEIEIDRLVLPGTLTKIGDGALYSCGFKEIKFAPKYKKLVIGERAFGARLETIKLPEGTYEIGAGATQYAKNLTIPASVKKIGAKNVSAWTENVKISSRNRKFKMKDGMLYTANGKTLLGITKKVAEKSRVKISSKTKRIAECVFERCNIKQIDLGGNVTEISKGAFANCAKLKKVTGTGKLKKIGYGAFDGCAKLKNIQDVSRVKVIENAAFWGTDKLTLPISANMDIADCAFSGNYMDKAPNMQFVIPENDPVYKVENGLLIKTKGNESTVIKQLNSMESIEVPEGVTGVPVVLGADRKCKDIVFPSTLKTQTSCMFSNGGTVTYKSATVPEFKTGFCMENVSGEATVVIVPRGSVESYKQAMCEGSKYTSNRYMDTEVKELLEDGSVVIQEQ